MSKIALDSVRLAIILGAILPGVGHIYLGEIKKGIRIIIIIILFGIVSNSFFQTFYSIFNTTLTIGLIQLSTLIPLVIWIWQFKDLNKVIKKITGRSMEEIGPPLEK